jgi:hypothetical protein
MSESVTDPSVEAEHTADPVRLAREVLDNEYRCNTDQSTRILAKEVIRLSEQRDPVKPESELSELGKQWMRPPEELIALSRMVQEASMVTVTAGSADDDAREYLCKIASLRLSRQLLKEYSRLSEQREAADPYFNGPDGLSCCPKDSPCKEHKSEAAEGTCVCGGFPNGKCVDHDCPNHTGDTSFGRCPLCPTEPASVPPKSNEVAAVKARPNPLCMICEDVGIPAGGHSRFFCSCPKGISYEKQARNLGWKQHGH